ncbi:MAG: hypothetical protein ACTHYM_12785 [Actinomycetaceae bacterium]
MTTSAVTTSTRPTPFRARRASGTTYPPSPTRSPAPGGRYLRRRTLARAAELVARAVRWALHDELSHRIDSVPEHRRARLEVHLLPVNYR